MTHRYKQKVAQAVPSTTLVIERNRGNDSFSCMIRKSSGKRKMAYDPVSHFSYFSLYRQLIPAFMILKDNPLFLHPEKVIGHLTGPDVQLLAYLIF